MTYCVKTDIYDVYGETNTKKWADLDNDEDSAKIDARIAKAIAWADNEIDSRLRKSLYSLPLQDEDGDTPPDILNTAALLAGVWLYENRGVNDFDPDTGAAVHRLAYQRDRAIRTIREILAGQRTILAITQFDSYPCGG